MKIKISEATELSIEILKKFGFSQEEAELSTENFIEGEITGKKSHGLVRIPWIKKKIDSNSISLDNTEISVVKETPVSLLLDGKGKTGFYVVNKALEMGIKKVKSSGMCIVGTTNTQATSGLIGLYARKAAAENLIFLAFNNSPSAVAPYGSSKAMFGTNPFTVGLPSNDAPVILDFSTSNGNIGEIITAKSKRETLPEETYLNEAGDYSTNPVEIYKDKVIGALLPIAGHKGSGLAFIVELLGGALTASRVGNNVKGGWGSLMILIDPNILRDLADFKADVSTAIDELKNSPKMKGFDEIYYPGERSQKNRAEAIESGEFDIDEKLYAELNSLY